MADLSSKSDDADGNAINSVQAGSGNKEMHLWSENNYTMRYVSNFALLLILSVYLSISLC